MYLDLLANPPLIASNHTQLLSRRSQNLPPISQDLFKKNQRELCALGEYFGLQGGENFSFLSGDFVELFVHLRDKKIGFAISNHQQAYQAYKLTQNLCDFTPIIPDQESGIISALPDCDVYILPLINQDLLTLNPISQLKANILNKNPNAIFVIDISYAVARGEKLGFDPCLQTILLCDGESLGFLRGYGIYLTTDQHFSLFPPTRYIDGLYSAILEEIQRRATPNKQDYKDQVFELLQKELGDDMMLFAPLTSSLPNTLALRLRHIKARSLLQSLFLEEIFAINGQECLFGFASPSFVLQEMGYTQDQARELLSLSFDEFSPHVFKTLASHYKNLRILEI
ncbi:hypothetical protein [Helicobacter pametensis]|uniref:hypothetical protein n=1 Tax=Helicobacter pametensis TaxID=95149 RepID=UPI0004AE5B49|nr:hypothetical protein [Helicobacter pametensis]